MSSGAGELIWSAWVALPPAPRVRIGETDRPQARRDSTARRECEVRSEDSALIERCLANDQRAFRELIRRYERAVYSLARRMVDDEEDARDIAQEAFIRAFRSLESFERSRPFSSWIFKITSNLCIDHYRRRRLATVSLDAPVDDDPSRHLEIADQRPRPDEETARSEEERRMERLVRSLPPTYRVVILLRHQSDLSYEEIAAALDVPLGTVKARLHRAHHLLRRKLEARGERATRGRIGT
jgi:RNA polymerase sigma-70 factor (ECF subfamily)